MLRPPGEQGATNETGADVTHSALQDVLWTNKDQINGWNFVQENGEVYAAENPMAYAHGTGIAA